MAPVTRTRSKALDQATNEEDSRITSASASDAETTSPLRGSGKPNEKRTNSSSTAANQKLAVRTREEAGEDKGGGKGEDEHEDKAIRTDTQLLNEKSKRPLTSSVADSQDGDSASEDGDTDNVNVNAKVDDAAPEPQSATEQLEEEAGRHLASQSLEPDLESIPQKTKGEAKKKHVVFGDDDGDVDEYVAAAAETAQHLAPAAADNGEEDDDSDDAPEAVSTKTAAKESLESAKALADATEKQATLLRRKRQERDNLYKEQAQKRKRTTQPDVDSDEPREGEAASATTTGRRRAEKLKLTGMLPAEFLADSESESEDEAVLRRVAKKPKKINFEDAIHSLGKEGGRAPRDEVVGSTVYRVIADKGDKKLAPKMHKNTRNVKEGLLRRKRAAVTPNKRNGFFLRK